jgi:ribosome biogenesis protein BRX1
VRSPLRPKYNKHTQPPPPPLKIWVRNYQILAESASTAKEANAQKKLTGHAHSTSLIEIGPRFILNPIRIFRGSFGGQTLYVNESFVNPNVIRSMKKKEEGDKYVRRKGAESKRKRRDEGIVVPMDPLSDVFR